MQYLGSQRPQLQIKAAKKKKLTGTGDESMPLRNLPPISDESVLKNLEMYKSNDTKANVLFLETESKH